MQPRSSTMSPMTGDGGRSSDDGDGSPTLTFTREKRSLSAADVSRFQVRKLSTAESNGTDDGRALSPGSEYTDAGDDGNSGGEGLSPAAVFAAAATASAVENDA